ncbi:unnamed protein product [Nesidiocoris tenuis]|nr:unnamed protein product [Nesidiocoris tenuis]
MKVSTAVTLAIIAAFCTSSVVSSNILVLMPIPFTSHILTFKPLFIELANRGHNVTYIGALNLPKTPNLQQTLVKNESIDHILEKLVAALRQTDSWGFLSYFWKYGSELNEVVLDQPAIRNLLNDESSHFDVIISEPYFLQEAFIVFGHKFNVPTVAIFPLGPTIWASYLSGNPMPFSYVPSYKTSFSDHMSFGERVQNTLLQLYEFLGTKYYYLPIIENVARRKLIYKGSENRPPLEELLTRVSLNLVDYHFSSSYNRPFGSNIVPVGGLTLARQKMEPLDKALSDLMDRSDGVIYFSLGSHIKVSALGEEAVAEIMKAFSKLSSYQILMKWNDILPPTGLSPNVHISSWFPQPSILGHPKCKVMIGHGGLHGIMEAAHHGVPFVGIPCFSDQEFNTKFVVSAGFGLRVGKEELTAENILRAVRALLEEPKYKEAAVRRSKIAKDRMVDPLDQAVYSVEYAIRHKAADHLRPAVLDLYWYQYLLLDVLLVIVVFPIVVIYMLIKCAKFHIPKFATQPPLQHEKSRKILKNKGNKS